MRTQNLSRLLMVGALIALMAVFAANTTAAQQSSGSANKQVLQLFEKGVSLFEEEKYAEARQAFDKILAMQPGSRTALQMRKKAEVGLFARMKSRDELAPVAERFIRLMNDALREKRQTVGDMEETLLNFQSDNTETYGKALNRINSHGPYAIPHLLKFLTRAGEKNQRIVARTIMAINEIGGDAVQPLVAALNTENSLLKTRIVGLLEQTGDWRAVPALLSIATADDTDESLKEAAESALKAITDKNSAGLPSPADAYARLGEAYLHEKHDMVGYLDLASGDLWDWNPDAEELKNKLVYRNYPSYVYFLRQGTNVVLEGLRRNPDDTRLKTLLLTLQTVQMTRCRMFSNKDYVTRLGGEQASGASTEVASELLARLQKNWPVLAHMYSPEVVGLSLEETMDMGDSMSALQLLKLLLKKPALTADNGGDSLLKAVEYPDKNIRYTAAVGAVEQSPTGTLGKPDTVVQVLSSALQQATAKTSLLVFDDFNARNTVASVLRRRGVTTVGSRANTAEVNNSLNLQPAIDAVFLTGNVPASTFKRLLDSLKSDTRTKDVPVYVVVNSRKESVERAQGIERRIKLGQVKSPDFERLVQEQLLQQSNTPLTGEKEKTVLQAVQALLDVQPGATKYPVAKLETALVRALRGYGENVQDGALRALARFGSGDALGPVSKKLTREEVSADLKAQACRTLAEVMRRTDASPSSRIVERIKNALSHDDAAVQQAAAEALGAADLPAKEMLELKKEYSRLQAVGQ